MNNIIKKLKGFPFNNNQKKELIDTITNVCNENIKNIDGLEWSYLNDVDTYGIDLGLPSGTIWADRNVGAKSVDIDKDPGTLLFWGNLVNNGTGQLNDKWFTQNNYKYSKYNDTDGKYILDKEDDAATVLFGEHWCMPSKKDCEELINCCKIYYATDWFVELEGPNGNHIKFVKPHNSITHSVSIDTLCWTNELLRYGNYAVHLNYKHPNLTTSEFKERSTFSFVRPIYKPKN